MEFWFHKSAHFYHAYNKDKSRSADRQGGKKAPAETNRLRGLSTVRVEGGLNPSDSIFFSDSLHPFFFLRHLQYPLFFFFFSRMNLIITSPVPLNILQRPLFSLYVSKMSINLRKLLLMGRRSPNFGRVIGFMQIHRWLKRLAFALGNFFSLSLSISSLL